MKIIVAVVAVVIVLLSPLAWLSPAVADHGGSAHWRPGLVLSVCADVGLDPGPSLAAWATAGFPNRTEPGCPVVQWSRRGSTGTTARMFYRWASATAQYDGLTTLTYEYLPLTDLGLHISRCVVNVRPGMPPEQHRRTLLHETGHCIGLAHTADTTSIMGGGGGISQHDRDVVAVMYQPHVG